MALYNEISMDDYAKINARNQRNAAEKAAQQLAQRQAAQQAANQKKTGNSLVDTLVGIATGIRDKVVDAGATLGNIGKTIAGGINQIGANKSIENIQKDDSKRRNEIAKKYGFNSYTEAINSDKVGDDFWNEIKGSNKQTQDMQKANTEAYRNKVSDVTKIDLNKAKGQALNTIDTVGMALPGGAGVAANIAGGGLAGIGDEYKAAAREGRAFNAQNARTNALAGMAGGAAGSAAGGLLNKAAAKTSGNALGKLLASNVGKGIGSGAAAGAAAGATATLANGGSIEDALKSAAQAAKGGALGGGVMAGAMGLAGRGVQALQNRRNGTNISEPVDAQIVQKNRIEAPTTRAIEAETPSTRRGIAITDLNAGVEDVPVRVVNSAEPVQGRGRYIDGVVSGQRLPEATAQDYGNAFARYTGVPELGEESLVRAMGNPDTYFGSEDGYNTLLDATPKNLQETLRQAARDGEYMQNPYAQYEQYGISNQDSLPTLNRDEYYNDVTGNLKRNGGALSAEDIPDYMQSHLRQDGNIKNDVILNELFGDNMDLRDQYALYDEIAQVRNNNPTYTTDNAAMGLASDQNAANAIMKGIVDDGKQAIAVQGGPAIPTEVPVTNRATRVAEPTYTESTIPARNYEQTVAGMPEAEIVTRTAAQVAPEQRVATQEPQIDYDTQVQRQKAQIAADKAKKQAIGGVLEQYGTTRLSDRIEGLPTAIDDMLSLGLTDRAEIELFSKKLASGDSELAKAIRTSLNDAAPIDGKWGFTWEQVFDSAGAASNEAAQKQIKSFYESQAKKLLRADKNGQFNRNDVYDFGKALEKEGYKKYDRGVRNQNTNTQVYGEALINMSQDIISKATDGVDVSDKFDANKLKNLLPGNKAWEDRVDDLSANAKTVQDLRSAMASPTKMNLLKEAEEYNLNTYGQNVGGKGKGGAAVKAGKALITGKPIQAAEAGAELVLGSDKAKQKAIKKSYENYKKYQAQANGEDPTKTGKLAGVKGKIANFKDAGIVQGVKNLAGKAGNVAQALNDTTATNIALGGTTLGDIAQRATNRGISQSQSEFARNRAEQAAANAAVEQATNDFNMAQTNAQNAMLAVQNQNNGTAQLDRIARAMDLAMAAGDINAYGQLADLYKQAYGIYELQNPQTKQETKALSANQSKALAAQQQLEQLAQMSPDFGTVASNIPLVNALVDMTGGNEYANQAEALATTLGYLLSGANIKESEAKRIGQSYVPNAFDSENVRQQKLDRARQLIQSYMSDTGAIQQ